MEGPVCTGAIFSGNRRNFFGAGGGKGLIIIYTPKVIPWGQMEKQTNKQTDGRTDGQIFTQCIQG
jgi:hypothetical protein